MNSLRQNKYSRQLLKDLSDIFQLHVNPHVPKCLVTLTSTEVSPDLSLCKVYVSILPLKDASEVMELLDHRKSEIRKFLGNQIGKRVRKIPELAFFHDTTEEEASHLDRLIDNLNIPPEK